MPPTTIADLLALLTAEPGRPRITWYGDGGERVELSGAVLVNWVNKTANLLVEEFDAGPGARIGLHLPMHWRSIVWALAAWRLGACVVLDSRTALDALVTNQPPRRMTVPTVAVALAGLARRFDDELPAGAIDAASAVMTYGDVLGWSPPLDPLADALDDGTAQIRHIDLMPAPADSGRTLLAAVPALTIVSMAQSLRVLAGDGSLVLVDVPTAAALGADPSRRARLVQSELVTADLLG
ncbi:TIGR03089 family protein [Cellulomonas sp. McL0617]|uniref:TIGR03089 family protein n=1 Tax=Cellulomonas sp. McL0617 TaxID=3415675 RepID=UPI003CF00EEC